MRPVLSLPVPVLMVFLAWLAPVRLAAQEALRPGPEGRGLHIQLGDRAVLGSDQERTDLDCTVEPLDPQLQFDLSFRAGYAARIPLAALAGPGNALRVLFRVTPLDTPHAKATYFHQRFTVPPIEEGAAGDASLPGEYRLGPGRYDVDWLMRDRAERVCAKSWEVEAKVDDAVEELGASALAATVSEAMKDIFAAEPPVRRAAGPRRYIRIVASFTPTAASRVSLSEYDLRAVVSMLRAVSREPQLGDFDLIAYNAHEERVFFEQKRTGRIDFPALGEAVEDSQGGMVTLSQLQEEDSGERFLHELLRQQLVAEGRSPDAVLLLGPKVIFERNPSPLKLPADARLTFPVLHFVYNRNPRAYPWRDAVSSALRSVGAREFDIIDPKDFARALREMMETLTSQTATDSD